MAQWEYRVEYLGTAIGMPDTTEMERSLSRLGVDGWDCYSVIVSGEDVDGARKGGLSALTAKPAAVAFLKRRID